MKNQSDWKAVDWSRSNKEIAATLGVSKQAVWAKRRRIAEPPKPPGPRQNTPAAKWKNVDWSRSNEEIAATLGVSKQVVWGKRRRLAKPPKPPKPPKPHRPGKQTPAAKWKNVDWSRSNEEIAAEFSVKPASVRVIRYLLNGKSGIGMTRYDEGTLAERFARFVAMARRRNEKKSMPITPSKSMLRLFDDVLEFLQT